jgi:hypothetical protein
VIFDIWSPVGGACRIQGPVSGRKNSVPGAASDIRHIDLTNGASFSGRDLFDIRDRCGNQRIEPAPALCYCYDEPGAGFGSDRVQSLVRRCSGGENDLTRAF